MIVKFSDIKHDFYGNIEQPVLVLKRPDGRKISTISNYFELKPIFRFNDVSEITFTVPAYYDGCKNNGYEEISGTRLVEIEPFGDFILINPKTVNDGIREIKECKAYSLEYALNYKRAEIPSGTYCFYNPANNENTITTIISELLPDWKFGTIDDELIGKHRTFDATDDNLYSFMMGALQEAYNCLFLFDTKNKIINVKYADNEVSNLPIYLSYSNLVKNVEVEELSEEIVTALSGYGSGEEVTIAGVNPNGTNTIYNLDYYITKGDLPENLANKWLAYQSNLELYQSIYSNQIILRRDKRSELNTASALLTNLRKDYEALEDTYLTVSTEKHEGYQEELNKLKAQKDAKYSEVLFQQEIVDDLETMIAEINKQIKGITEICSLKGFFTTSELLTLSPYFKHDSLVEDTFVVPEYSASILPSNSSILENKNDASLKIVGTKIYASNLAQVFNTDEDGTFIPFVIDSESGEKYANTITDGVFNTEELNEELVYSTVNQLNEDVKKKTYEFQGGVLTFSYQDTKAVDGKTIREDIVITGDIVSVNFHYNTEDLLLPEEGEELNDLSKAGAFLVTAVLNNAKYKDISYPTMNLSIQGALSNHYPTITDDDIKIEIDKAVFHSTASASEYQKQAVIQELYDYTESTLEKLAWPSYEFSVESANFLFAQEFEPFKDQLELGSTIYLALDSNDNKIIRPILIEIEFNYDNATEFSLLFGNKFHASDSKFQLADLITDATKSSHSLDLNKSDYISYKESKAGSQVAALTTSNYDIAQRSIVNSSNQNVEWNSRGLFVRKKLDNGEFDGKQVGLINGMLAFTEDGWDTVKIGIGHFKDDNLGRDMWGIVAPNIIGTLFIGENLIIENTVLNEDGTSVIKQFKVDETGAWLNNTSLVFSQEKDPDTGLGGGRMFIDPRYGIAAGNDKLFSLSGTEIEPSFIDENGKLILDDSILGDTVVDEEGNTQKTPYLPINTQFFFDIRTGNAYFGGTVNGAKIMGGTITGAALANGAVDAGTHISGVLNPDQIQGLSSINFKDGKIVADEISADKIVGDVVVANAALADRIIINENNAKLAITPEYGIIAGNTELFSLDEETGKIISPTFIDDDGNLIIDNETGAPNNASFYFDINTGQAYFAGAINANQITAGTIDAEKIDVVNLNANNITAGTINAENIDVINLDAGNITAGYIDANQIDVTNLNADNITAGDITADRIKANVISAIEGTFGNVEADTAFVKHLLTAGSILTNDVHSATVDASTYLRGVTILGDFIQGNTLKADRLILKGADGVYKALNIDALGEKAFNEIVDDAENSNVTPYVYEGLHGKVMLAHTITATEINVSNLFAQDIFATGTISGGTFLQGGRTIKKIQSTDESGNLLYNEVGEPIYEVDSNGKYLYENNGFSYIGEDGKKKYYTNGTYIGDLGISLGNSLVYDAETNKLIVSGEIIASRLTLDSDAVIEGLTGYVTSSELSDSLNDYAKTDSLNVYIKKDGSIGTIPADGATEAGNNTGFIVSSNGLLKASNAIIYGTIYATDGKFAGKISSNEGDIGGWIIDSKRMYNYSDADGNSVANSSSALSVAYIANPSFQNKNAFYIGTREAVTDSWTTKFRVRYDGTLYADDATITGKITAQDGEIGGFTIKSDYLYSGDISSFTASYSSSKIDETTGESSGTDTEGVYIGSNGIRLGADFKIYPSGTLVSGHRIYLPNGKGLRAMKYGKTLASWNDSNVLVWSCDREFTNKDNQYANIPLRDRVILGNINNSAATEIRSPSTLFLKCGGIEGDTFARTLIFTYTDNNANDTEIDEAFFMPGLTNKTNLGGINYRWKEIYSKNGNFSGTVSVDNNLSVGNNLSVSGSITSNNYIKTSDIRSSGTLYFKCDGETDNSSRYTLRFYHYNWTENGTTYNRGVFAPTLSSTFSDSGDDAKVVSSRTTLGLSTYPWHNVYSAKGTILVSDRNKKDSIQTIHSQDKYIKMFDLLNPVSFKFKDGDRTHIGFISQDVEDALISLGMTSSDFGGFCKDVKREEKIQNNGTVLGEPVVDEYGNEQYDYSLRYEEFIALNTAKIKQLEKIIESLSSELTELKTQLNN